MDWVKRINSVMDYVEENLDGEIDDKKIASIFASPQGMFQRIFANITDTKLSEYIRKRRLTQAAAEIKSTDEKIIDVAMKYGYNSTVAFCAAFKSFHGITPSDMRKSGAQPKSFYRFAFTLALSEKGVENMQYYNADSAEYLMRQMVNKECKRQYLQNIAEHNGVKCASDGYRAAVMLPNGTADWNLSDAYFDTDDTDTPKGKLNTLFNYRSDNGLHFNLSKEQAALLLVSLDGVKTDHERKYFSLPAEDKDKTPKAIVCVDMNTMGIITETMAAAADLKWRPDTPIMAFNPRLIEDALKFIMCSDHENIEVYFNGNLDPLIFKSGRLYALVLPLKLKYEAA